MQHQNSQRGFSLIELQIVCVIIGIVASKLVDAFHRPAIVLSIDGDVAHGSCRSIPSFNVLAALESCGDVMMKFGGHKQAAGLTIEAARIRELRARVNDHADL